jgi:hypothetical protein
MDDYNNQTIISASSGGAAAFVRSIAALIFAALCV